MSNQEIRDLRQKNAEIRAGTVHGSDNKGHSYYTLLSMNC